MAVRHHRFRVLNSAENLGAGGENQGAKRLGVFVIEGTIDEGAVGLSGQSSVEGEGLERTLDPPNVVQRDRGTLCDWFEHAGSRGRAAAQ